MTEQEIQTAWIDEMQKLVGVLYTSNQLLTMRLDNAQAELGIVVARADALLESKRSADKTIAELQEQIAPDRKVNRKVRDGTSTNQSNGTNSE